MDGDFRRVEIDFSLQQQGARDAVLMRLRRWDRQVFHPDKTARLRPYQLRYVKALVRAYERYYAPILQLATGAGKTAIFAEMIRRLVGLRILVLVHRRELVAQASRKLADVGVKHGIIAAGYDANPDLPVQVASVQTLARRPKLGLGFHLVVIDECHHARAASWRRVLRMLPQAVLLGCTATPARLDGKGLGVEHGGVFDTIVCGSPIAELIEDGYLSPVRCFSPARIIDTTGLRTKLGDYELSGLAAASDQVVITGDAVEQYRKHADHQAAIAFCVTVAHAQHVAAAFRAAGYRSECVHGGLPTVERDRLIAGLGNGEIEVLTSCEIISEGLDVPAVGAVILLRPTKSLTLYLQQIGRGMRPAPGKAALVVLDHAAAMCSVTDYRSTTASGASLASRNSPAKHRSRRVPNAARSLPVRRRYARAVATFSGSRVETASGELIEIQSEAALLEMPYWRIVRMRLSEAQLRAYADAHGYKPGWVWYRLQEQVNASAEALLG